VGRPHAYNASKLASTENQHLLGRKNAIVHAGHFDVDVSLVVYPFDDLEQASLDYSINVNMLAGLFNTESAFDPNAVSDAGAQGCAQFMPSTWNWLYSIGVFTGDMDVWSCEDSVRMAAIKLSRDGWSDSGGWKQALYAYLGAGADWYVERVQFWGNLYQNEVV